LVIILRGHKTAPTKKQNGLNATEGKKKEKRDDHGKEEKTGLKKVTGQFVPAQANEWGKKKRYLSKKKTIQQTKLGGGSL